MHRDHDHMIISFLLYAFYICIHYLLSVILILTVHFGCECMKGPLSMGYVYVHTLHMYIYMNRVSIKFLMS